MPKSKLKKCRRLVCRKEFEPAKYWQDFCSPKCRIDDRKELTAKALKFYREHKESA